MSAPRVRRTVARMPFFSRVAANFSMVALAELENPLSSTGLTGIRFTCIGIVSVLLRRRELRSEARVKAFSTESFLPDISVYSKDILLPVASK